MLKTHKFSDRQIFTEKVFIALSFLRGLSNDATKTSYDSPRFEVPFIASHRKDYFEGVLNRQDLWSIYDLDLKYQALEARRKQIRASVSEIREISEAAVEDLYIDQMIGKSRTMDDFADVMGYLQLYYASELRKSEEVKSKILKRSVKRTPYEDAQRAEISGFVKLFNIDPKSFVESLVSHSSEFVPEDVDETPLSAASRFVVPKSPFYNEEKVIEGIDYISVEKFITFAFLKAARMMLGSQIAADPFLRQFVRKVYETDAILTVTPTEKGKREIQPLHPFYVCFCLFISFLITLITFSLSNI